MSDIVLEWHDFFIMAGTAAVTLLGLLFVALSLNIDVVIHETKAYLLSLARQTFLGFMFVLFISLLFLAPHTTPRVQGTELIFFGTFLMALSARALMVVLRHPDPARARRFVVLRDAGSLIGGGLLILSGTRLVKGDPDGINSLAMTLILIFGFSAGSAWALLIEVGKMKADLLRPEPTVERPPPPLSPGT